jgi:hypothetical protein
MTETKTNFQILNELITNHIMTILNEEMSGWNRIHLYAIGDHWVAFERSAYALSRIFRDSLPITVLNLKNYPFPVIMCSVHYEEIEFGRHALSCWVNTSVSKLTSSPSIQYAITVTSIAQPVAHSPKIGQHWTLLQRSCQTF